MTDLKVKDGEVDRMLILKHREMHLRNGGVTTKTHQIKVGKKTFSIVSHWKEATLRMEKRVNGSEQYLGIALETTRKVMQRCELGHDHVVKTNKDEWHFFELPWEHIDNFIEWLQLGSYSEVARAESRSDVLLKEVLKFLTIVEEDKMLKPHVKKIAQKIKAYFHMDGGYQDAPVPQKLVDEGWKDITKGL